MIYKLRSIQKYLKVMICCFVLNFTSSLCYADKDLITLFPLDKYNQDVESWIPSNDPNYDKSLLNSEIQQKYLHNFFEHYYGSLSPWNTEYVKQILHQSKPNDLKNIEEKIIDNFDNVNKSNDQKGHGENFRPYDINWIMEIKNNINLLQFDNLNYQSNRRAITIENLHARALPTEDVHFYDHKLAGQGFPFDNLQMSALWVGTPIYILAETQDHAWSLVLTPDYIAWVKTNGIARVNKEFVDTWIRAAKNKLIAITHTRVPILDDKENFLFLAYVGAFFPGSTDSRSFKIMVPSIDANRNAIIKHARVSDEQASSMPMLATPHHFSKMIQTLINRPYGWGGMYFYNDCSAELKSLFIPFGIWLPRHSSDQVTIGKMIDVTSFKPEKRISYLIENGQPFLTLIYVGGHIVLYIGNYKDVNNEKVYIPLIYQNIWGLSPNPPVRRVVIGKSLLFPMLIQYPEDVSLTSLAAKKYFQIAYLNEFVESTNVKLKHIDLNKLMYGEKD